MTAVFEVSGTRAITSAYAAGPWNPQLQHGGAPSALAVWAAERIPTNVPMQIARLTIDLLRPVPIAPLDIETAVVREGKKIQLCAIIFKSNGVEVVRASVLKIRRDRFELPGTIGAQPLDRPLPHDMSPPTESPPYGNSFVSGIELRIVRGGFRQLGPASIWFRAHRPIVAGESISPAMRAVMTADFSNGISSVLDFERWTFINGDLSVNFARMPVGDWILLDAESWIGPEGSGIACARLADEQGYFARSVQSLVVEPRP